jgi:hypothetical protein
LTKLSPDASTIVYSTYIPSDRGVAAVSISPSGNVYVAGQTGVGFPVTNSAAQICPGGQDDIFIARLDPNGALLDATYLGGPYNDGPAALSAADQSTRVGGYIRAAGTLPRFSLATPPAPIRSV